MFVKDNILMGLQTKSVVLTKLFDSVQASGQESNAPWWLFWLLLIIALLSVVVWWIIDRSQQKATPVTEATATPLPTTETKAAPVVEEVSAPAPVETEAEPAAEVEATPPPVAEPPAPSADDLTRIEGIGPKISGVLQEAGIPTFTQLANTEVNRLKEILKEANLRLADPSTWPEQAKLAAAGEWEALETLQDNLKGGRRVE